ncbi:MAG: hypothetical protein ACKPKO_40405, partial [Candidatus Fonsibacter sp.]
MGRRQTFAHPNDVENRRYHRFVLPESLPEPESITAPPSTPPSTLTGPPLPQQSTLAGPPLPPPPVVTVPGSLPAGARVPKKKKGQRADIHYMSKADNPNKATSSRGQLAGLVDIVGNTWCTLTSNMERASPLLKEP